MMLGCNDTITLWRRPKDPQAGLIDAFTRFNVPDSVKWDESIERGITPTGTVINRIVEIMIPYSELYVLELKNGDYIAKGEHMFDITLTSPNKVDEVRERLGNDFVQVKTVSDFTRNRHGKHWWVICV